MVSWKSTSCRKKMGGKKVNIKNRTENTWYFCYSWWMEREKLFWRRNKSKHKHLCYWKPMKILKKTGSKNWHANPTNTNGTGEIWLNIALPFLWCNLFHEYKWCKKVVIPTIPMLICIGTWNEFNNNSF